MALAARCNQNAFQLWSWGEDRRPGSLVLRNRGTGLCLDVSEEGAVKQSECSAAQTEAFNWMGALLVSSEHLLVLALCSAAEGGDCFREMAPGFTRVLAQPEDHSIAREPGQQWAAEAPGAAGSTL